MLLLYNNQNGAKASSNLIATESTHPNSEGQGTGSQSVVQKRLRSQQPLYVSGQSQQQAALNALAVAQSQLNNKHLQL